MKLFLDDMRNPPDNTWTVARTYDQARDLIRYNYLEEISFDHDLGEVESRHFPIGYHPTGYDLLCWIEELVLTEDLPSPIMNVHSANPVGVRRMQIAITALESRLSLKDGKNDATTS